MDGTIRTLPYAHFLSNSDSQLHLFCSTTGISSGRIVYQFGFLYKYILRGRVKLGSGFSYKGFLIF